MIGKILWIGLLAGAVATTVDFVIVRIAAALTNASPQFAPFTLLPIASGGFGGAFGASIVFWILGLIFEQPRTIFICIAVALLIASFHLPFRLTGHASPRFAGATLAMQITLCLMHTIVAATSVTALIKYAR